VITVARTVAWLSSPPALTPVAHCRTVLSVSSTWPPCTASTPASTTSEIVSPVNFPVPSLTTTPVLAPSIRVLVASIVPAGLTVIPCVPDWLIAQSSRVRTPMSPAYAPDDDRLIVLRRAVSRPPTHALAPIPSPR
jgi:hypothetical protein